MNPRHSLRKILGLYEHELNSWIEASLRRVSGVLDVGANDGYFTFGCVAAFDRLGKNGTVVAFEPEEEHIQSLKASARNQENSLVDVQIIEAVVSRTIGPGKTTLDALPTPFGRARANTLVKIDVEGAEMDVIAGAETWLHPGNAFLIELHNEAFLAPILELFAAHGIQLNKINQSPLPILGSERREKENCWLVTELAAV
jgi:predicted RNA methylase